jgi:putative membrane protein
MLSALVAAAHFIAAFGVVAAVFYEWLTFNRTPTLSEARRIQLCDAIYGLSSIALIVAGLLRVYYFEKGSDFYLSSPFFIAKIVLFGVVGLLSIYPTKQFIKWRPVTRAGKAPHMDEATFARISLLLKLEVVLLVVIVICASLMAKGIMS